MNLNGVVFADLAADVTHGYPSTRFAPPGGPVFSSDVQADTQVGLRYRLLVDQAGSRWKPALALRIGGTSAPLEEGILSRPRTVNSGKFWR